MKAKLTIDVTVIAEGGGFSTVIHSLPTGAFSINSDQLRPVLPEPDLPAPASTGPEEAPKKKGKK